MKKKRNLHLKVQEMCDCYASGDPLKSMSEMTHESQGEESAVKWLALAALHGINANAEKISISQSGDEKVRVTAEYRKTELPAPNAATARKIIDVIREITHIEDAKGKIPLSLGVRDSSIDLMIKIKSKGEKQKVSLRFGKT